jgi:hypothetical protein
VEPTPTAGPGDFVLQHVIVEWTKRSRGGAGAARRNAVPHGYPLPQAATGRGVHHVTCLEYRDFAATEEWVPLPAPGGPAAPWREHELRLRLDGAALHVLLEAGSYGMPRRPRRPAARLRPGEWLRWLINSRMHGDEDGWWYRLDAYNVVVGPHGADVFLGTPTRVVDERAYLR